MSARFALVVGSVVALSDASAQQPAPPRPLGPTVATAAESFGQLVFVRQVSGGVLVNDVANRRLLMLDQNLANPTVIADTTPATANAYSGRTASLIPFRGDSSLFADPSSMSMLVIDGSGKVARVMSIPRGQDAMTLGSSVFGSPGLDAAGRLVYRASPRFEMRRPPQQTANGSMVFSPPDIPDSAAVVRVDLSTRALDTVGFVKTQKIKMDMQRDDNGRVTMTSVTNPLPTVDEWAVLSDGSIALVRGRDYHVDWVRPDGSRESSAKIPFDWQRLTDEDKIAFIDSVKAARARLLASMPAPAAPGGAAGAAPPAGGPPGGGGVAGGGGEVRVFVGPGGEGGPPRGGAGPGAFGRGEVNFVPPSELPDYKPPFFAGAVRADAEGRLWIRTIPTKAIAGGFVYDVINGKGELVERVQVPKDRTIVGFGSGGTVYLVAREGSPTTTKLEKAKVR